MNGNQIDTSLPNWADIAAQELKRAGSIILLFDTFTRKQKNEVYEHFGGLEIYIQKSRLGHTWVQVSDIKKRTSSKGALVGNEEVFALGSKVIRGNEILKGDSDSLFHRCPVCNQLLLREENFYRHKGRHTGYCKICHKYYLRWWRTREILSQAAGRGVSFQEWLMAGGPLKDPLSEGWQAEIDFRG